MAIEPSVTTAQWSEVSPNLPRSSGAYKAATVSVALVSGLKATISPPHCASVVVTDAQSPGCGRSCRESIPKLGAQRSDPSRSCNAGDQINTDIVVSVRTNCRAGSRKPMLRDAYDRKSVVSPRNPKKVGKNVLYVDRRTLP